MDTRGNFIKYQPLSPTNGSLIVEIFLAFHWYFYSSYCIPLDVRSPEIAHQGICTIKFSVFLGAQVPKSNVDVIKVFF